jgi:hypothetical protein
LAISQKNLLPYFLIFRSKAEKHRHRCLYICVGKFFLFLAISAWIYIVLTAMKQGNEALNASSLQFFLSVKRFIAVTFDRKTSSNASSPLLFIRNSSLNTSSPLLFKVT